jgi:DNA invertase Pin-like site-specific DNA recombinase
MERDLIRERVVAVLIAARARGRQGGHKAILTPKQIAMARQLLADSCPPERTGLPTYSAAISRSL